MRNSDEALIRAGNPEHDVGEGEVGEQLQVADKQVQPLDVRLARATLGEHEVGER